VHSSGNAGGAVAAGREFLLHAGNNVVQGFNLTDGDKLDLRQLLAGAPLAHDLANIGEFVRVLDEGQNHAGVGGGTRLEIAGPGGSAVVTLQGSGKLQLDDLLKHQSLHLPPQH